MATKKEAKRARRARLALARAEAERRKQEGAAPSEPGDTRLLRQRALGALALAVIVAAAFSPAFQAGFVWDDIAFIEEPLVRSPSGLKSIWLSPSDIRNEGHYWPLTYTTFWMEHRLWGENPLGYHIVNVLLYLGNVLLLWRLIRRLAVPGAWTVAAIWAVHPLHVESVVWIIERKDVLSGLFYLGAALAYLSFSETNRWSRYGLGLGLYALGLLAKSAVVTLPAAMLIWHWWQRGRVTARDLLRTAPFFLAGLLISLGDLAFYRFREVLSLDYSLLERTLIAARALWFYAVKLIWPTELAVIYPRWEVRATDALAWACLAAALALATALWLGRRRFGRGPLAGALFFAVTLSPALGFVDYGYMQFSFVADRFQYLASLGLIAVLVGAALHARRYVRGTANRAGPAILLAVLLALGTVTWRQATVWRDGVTLYGHIVSLNPAARNAHLNWSVVLNEAGRLEESLNAARIAADQRPEHPEAHSNLARALLDANDFEGAEASAARALAIDPKHPNALQNRAEALRKQGRLDEAIIAFRSRLEMHGDVPLAWTGLSGTLFDTGQYEEAIDAAERALRIDPDLPLAGTLRLIQGVAASKLGRLDEAAERFARALELDPGNLEALDRLAFVRSHQGRHEDALRLYRPLLETTANNAAIHANLGITLLNLERPREAIENLERALELDAAHENARLTLQEARAAARNEDSR